MKIALATTIVALTLVSCGKGSNFPVSDSNSLSQSATIETSSIEEYTQVRDLLLGQLINKMDFRNFNPTINESYFYKNEVELRAQKGTCVYEADIEEHYMTTKQRIYAIRFEKNLKEISGNVCSADDLKDQLLIDGYQIPLTGFKDSLLRAFKLNSERKIKYKDRDFNAIYNSKVVFTLDNNGFNAKLANGRKISFHKAEPKNANNIFLEENPDDALELDLSVIPRSAVITDFNEYDFPYVGAVSNSQIDDMGSNIHTQENIKTFGQFLDLIN